MRNIYIALIFIGCLSLAFAAGPYPPKPAAVSCTEDKPVTGCQTCAENDDDETQEDIPYECTLAETGYFINTVTLQAAACPRSCATCTEGTACITAVNPEAFTDQTAQSCKPGYAFDNGATDNTNLEGVCISVASDGAYTCVSDFIWGSTPNPQRKCIAKNATCQTGYALGASTNCDQCDPKYNQLSGVALNGNNEKYQINVCVNYQAPTPRSPVQCEATGTNPTTSCMTCEAGTCTKAAAGYFLNPSNQTVACSEQCSECSAANVCTACPSGITLDQNKNCLCSAGYVPNIDQSLITNPANSFTCVSYQEGAPCQTGYSWNTPSILADSTKQACISIYGTGSCFSETVADPKFDQTSFWNAPINTGTASQRQCVLKDQGNCQTGYSVNGIITTKITGDCKQCAAGILALSGVGVQGPNQYYKYDTLCQQKSEFEERPDGEACTATGTKSIGCETCEGGKCTKNSIGYFIQNNQPVACPLQCSECSDATACTECSDNSEKDATSNCVCSAGFVPSIEKSQATIANSYACVSQLLNFQCSDGYVWNAQTILPYPSDSQCISIYGTSSCYTNTIPDLSPEYIQTSFWNAPINPNTEEDRTCILTGTGSCLTGYSFGLKTSPITGDCNKCALTYPSPLSGVGAYGNNQYYKYDSLCQKKSQLPTRPDGVACTATGTSSIGCDTCDQGKCTKISEGYFNLNDQPVACPLQCTECTDAKTCTDCQANSELDPTTKNCVCSEGFVPSIEKSQATIANNYACVNQFMNYPCSENYVWNAETILPYPSDSQCISIYGTSSCYTNTDPNIPTEYIQTSFWNAPINPNTEEDRTCILTGTGDCQEGYSFDGTNTTKITGNCGQCATGYPTPLSGVGTYGSNQYYAFTTLCQQVTQFDERPAGVACKNDDTESEGCDTCAGGKCTQISKGYFIQNEQPVACPLQCSECTNATACTVCSDNSEKDVNNNCVCTNGYAPSIDRASATISNSYACISQIDNTLCSDNYVWNTPSILADSSSFECINIYDPKATCYVDSTPKTKLIQTGLWNAPINPATASDRSCVLTGSGSCLTNYATATNISANIQSSCIACAAGITLIKGIGQDARNQYYNYDLCLVQQATLLREQAVQCKGTDTSTNGCDVCNSANGTCTTPKPGYFTNKTNPNPQPSRLRNLAQVLEEGEGYVYACNSQCATCNDANSCLTCPIGYKLSEDKKNCLCSGENVIPSISQEQALLPTSSFVCINQFTSQCTLNYTWNSEVPLANLQEYKCINLYDDQCYIQRDALSGTNQTNFWTSAPNPGRKCALASTGTCVNTYSQNKEGQNSTTPGLTNNCDFCASGLVFSNNLLDQTCILPTNSSLLSLSFILLSLILALII